MTPSSLKDVHDDTHVGTGADAHAVPEVTPRDLAQFRIGDPLAEWVAKRLDCGLSPSLILKRDAARYYQLLDLVHETNPLPFTDEEINVISKIAWSTHQGSAPLSIPRLLWAEVADALRNPELAAAVEDPDALVARLRDLDPVSLYALVDRIENTPMRARWATT
jgi:hypothetical protein